MKVKKSEIAEELKTKYELTKQIEAMQQAKKQAKEEWLAIEEAALALLRATRFILEKLDKIEGELVRGGKNET